MEDNKGVFMGGAGGLEWEEEEWRGLCVGGGRVGGWLWTQKAVHYVEEGYPVSLATPVCSRCNSNIYL